MLKINIYRWITVHTEENQLREANHKPPLLQSLQRETVHLKYVISGYSAFMRQT